MTWTSLSYHCHPKTGMGCGHELTFRPNYCTGC